MKSPPGIVRHGPVVYLFRQTAGNTQVRPVDKINRRTARRADKIIDRPQLLHQLPEWLGVQHTQVNGMRRKPAVIVERYFKTLMPVADTLYPADQRVFHHLPGLKSS